MFKSKNLRKNLFLVGILVAIPATGWGVDDSSIFHYESTKVLPTLRIRNIPIPPSVVQAIIRFKAYFDEIKRSHALGLSSGQVAEIVRAKGDMASARDEIQDQIDQVADRICVEFDNAKTYIGAKAVKAVKKKGTVYFKNRESKKIVGFVPVNAPFYYRNKWNHVVKKVEQVEISRQEFETRWPGIANRDRFIVEGTRPAPHWVIEDLDCDPDGKLSAKSPDYRGTAQPHLPVQASLPVYGPELPDTISLSAQLNELLERIANMERRLNALNIEELAKVSDDSEKFGPPPYPGSSTNSAQDKDNNNYKAVSGL